MKKIEALADAIGRLNGCPNDPDSEAYQLRNPLLITSWAHPGKHETDEKGRRVFTSLLNGYKAALFDLQIKMEGNSRAKKVSPDSTLESLLACYEIYTRAALDHIVSFLRRSLKDADISCQTPLSYFLEN